MAEQTNTKAVRPMRGMKMRGGGMPVPKGAVKKGTMKRLLKYLFHYYKAALIITAVCIVLSSVASIVSSVFTKQLVDGIIVPGVQSPDKFGAVKGELISLVCTMGVLYLVGLIASVAYTQIMASVTQGVLDRFRTDMFNKMESLPIKYFDTHAHGDIMSTYTNDTDALRQLVGQSIPAVISGVVALISAVAVMFFYSIWLTLVVFACTAIMMAVIKKVGGASSKFMVAQQRSLAVEEGFMEEMMKGQKVVKVFTHEEAAERDFDKLNKQLFEDSEKAHIFGNILMPILGNIGNFLYVLIAIVGGLLICFAAPNLALENMVNGIWAWKEIPALSIGAIIAFLGLSRQFSQTVSQFSQQISMIAMGLAGASRIFELMDQEPEHDDGYVTLVNAKKDADGTISETEERTNLWAWRHYHKADNTVTYTELTGDIVMEHVDFGYVPEKQVLTDVSLYAKPGQKIAFVGATGAGKTTITNLINRFYDIADGKIRYDGININKINKKDLRRSLGIVLQDTNLFTGTVMENIRYGRLDATDEECIAAAERIYADRVAKRYPDGFYAKTEEGGEGLSAGEKQLISFARMVLKDPSVVILDEATSSVDSETEELIREALEILLKDKTAFIVAHRLSTIRKADRILYIADKGIAESGNHEQLLAKKGLYYRLNAGL